MEIQKAKLRKAIDQKNVEGARIYSENFIREKKQALHFLRYSSRLDAVALRLEASIRITEMSKAMGSTVHTMAATLKDMQPDKIANTMEDFEKAFEDMDVAAATMEGAMEASTNMTTPPDEVDALIAMVAAEANLDATALLDSAGQVGKTTPNVAEKTEDTLEARLAKLRS